MTDQVAQPIEEPMAARSPKRKAAPKAKTPAVATISAKEFEAALAEFEWSVDDFASRAGLHRSAVFRWINEDRVPPLAAWVFKLLRERRKMGERLSTPAE